MNIKEVTITERITRGQMMDESNTTGNVVAAAFNVKTRLRKRGVPAIGSLGLIAVEWGTLTIEFQRHNPLNGEGQYDDAWVYSWTGKPVPADIDLAQIATKGHALVMDMPLSALLTVDEEL
jgi:hypothetical protein